MGLLDPIARIPRYCARINLVRRWISSDLENRRQYVDMTQLDGLFPPETDPNRGRIDRLGDCAFVLRGFALPEADDLLAAVRQIEESAPFRHMVTPGGFTMSVALTNCGELGWTTDRRGYRYTRTDPQTGAPWPAMPKVFAHLARASAAAVGLAPFEPDACLLNRYRPGARMTLHQDRNERDLGAPVVSVSLGMTARFLFGGLRRSDPTQKIPLCHGDVAVWGGPDRMRYHGVMPLKGEPHTSLGEQRINFTFRKAG